MVRRRRRLTRGRLRRSLALALLAIVLALALKLFWPAGEAHVYAGLPRAGDWLTQLTTHNLDNPGFALGYSEWRAAPLWVAYIARSPARRDLPSRPSFTVDARTLRRVAHGDYTGSGFDRGHLAPNYLMALAYGPDAQAASFRMSNIVPQAPRHNQLLWQRLEELEADELVVRHGRLWVLTGPVYGAAPEWLDSGVAVPEALYRIWLREDDDGQLRVAAFLVPQRVCGDEELADFSVSVRDIETRTGLDFFHELPDALEERVETRASLEHWPAIREAGTEARYGERWDGRACPWR